jgi:transposase
MPNLHLLTQTFSQARHASGPHQFNGLGPPLTALRYTVNANLIFKWLPDPKYRPKPGAGSEDKGLRFLPVEIVADAKAPVAVPAVVANHIEIELAGGHRMRISGGYGPEALARLIRGLSM